MINYPALWQSGGMDGKAAPGLRGTPPDAVVFGSKVSVRARYLHIIIWNGYKIAGKAPFPLGIPQRRMPGRSGRGERARKQSCGGEAGVLYFVFSPQSCGVFPVFWAIGSPFRTETPVRHPFGIPGRAGPVLVALRQQAGRAILYHIIFLIMSILYHGK